MLGSNTEQPSIGKVVAVGPGSEEVPVTSKVGDEVLYSRYAGVELEVSPAPQINLPCAVS
jgi:chaperonin GroES